MKQKDEKQLVCPKCEGLNISSSGLSIANGEHINMTHYCDDCMEEFVVQKKNEFKRSYSLDNIALNIETGTAFEKFLYSAMGKDIDLVWFLTDPVHIKVDEWVPDGSICISMLGADREIHSFRVSADRWEKKQ